MKIRIAIAGAAIMALGLPLTAVAGNGDKATGGGQFLVPSDGGPGSTIGFNAQNVEPADGDERGEYAAKGQVQVIDRAEGKRGKDQVRFHGVVECMDAWTDGDRGFAVISGYERGATGENRDKFELYVMDGGEPNQGNDGINFDPDGAWDCGDGDEPDERPGDLARGNVQVRSSDDRTEDSGGPTPLRAAGIL